jgi:hypothetical protein
LECSLVRGSAVGHNLTNGSAQSSFGVEALFTSGRNHSEKQGAKIRL